MTVTIEEHVPLLESILGEWRERIGAAYAGYRNHVYRMVHFCFFLRSCGDEERRKVLIAGAFHDLGLWSDGTLDYLPPSIREATRYLEANGLAAWAPEIALMIDMHHKLRPYEDERHPLVEVFRQGDLIDFSLGLVRCGVPAAVIREVKGAFPNAGFHRFLMGRGWDWFSAHPLSPPPFVKW